MSANEIPKWRRVIQSSDEAKQVAGVNGEAKFSNPKPRCHACGRPENIVWVHGHGQCTYCHTNILPCCDGETCT